MIIPQEHDWYDLPRRHEALRRRVENAGAAALQFADDPARAVRLIGRMLKGIDPPPETFSEAVRRAEADNDGGG